MEKSFRQLAREIMDYYLGSEPSYATQVGCHKYDRMLRDPSPETMSRQVRDFKDFVDTLNSLPVESLTDDEQLDRDLALYILKLKIYEMEELRLDERFSRACDEIAYSLFFLFVREVPRFDERMESIAARLEQSPEFLERARKGMKSPYKLWNEVALETGTGLLDFIKEVGMKVETKSCEPTLRRRIRKAVEVATIAVRTHLDWMRSEVLPRASPATTVALEEYERYLEVKQYGVTLQEAIKLAEVYKDSVRDNMARIAGQLVPSGSIEEAVAKMKADHYPNAAETIQAYRDSASRAREFMLSKDLVTLPDDERLILMDTPGFMLPVMPFAAQFEPGKFDGNRTGLFLVSLEGANPDILGEHSRAGIANTTVHEGYPGHHLQGICSNTHPSLVRILVASPDFSEGWGLYSEQLMISSGYNDTPLSHLTNLNDLLFRIVRLIVEVKLVTGEITLNGAADILARECGMNAESAAIEAKACAMNPTYYFSYFIGKLGIEQLRDDVQKAMGSKFSLKFFHDAMVYSGCMPMSFMRRAVALRMKTEYGIELGERTESLFEYGMRKAGR